MLAGRVQEKNDVDTYIRTPRRFQVGEADDYP